MSIQQGTIAAKIVGLNQTKNGLSNVLEQWGEEVPQTFGAYPNAFNNVFENLDEKIDAVSASLSDYLPLSGGTVDKLSVDSPEFYVRNLLSVNVENDKMGGLMLGSNIYNATPPVVDGDKQYAPILIGNDLRSPDGAPMPSIAVGNNSLVRYGGIAIGGATGMSYEYDFGVGAPNADSVHLINPLRRDVVLSTLQFVDENGDAATSALYASDRITIVYSTGILIPFTVSQTTGKWGRYVTQRIGGRIRTVWQDADDSVVLAQQSVAYYSHYTPQYLKLKFDPEEINSVDMGAAELFSIAIGNNTMAGAYLSSDGSYQQSPFAGAIAIGAGSIAKDKGTVVIGSNSVAEGNKSIAFGFNAFTSADNAIQFGTGTNSTTQSVQFWDKTLLSGNNLTIVKERLPSDVVFVDSLDDYVDLSSEQTITGSKHFNGAVTISAEYDADQDSSSFQILGNNPSIEIVSTTNNERAQIFGAEIALVNSDNSYTSYGKNSITKYDANWIPTAEYTFPSSGGTFAMANAINTAIGTINTNFTNLKNAINGNNDIAYLTKNTLNSGWSIYDGDNGTANRLRLYHYGKFGYIFGTVKSTSVLNANTTYTIGTLNLPSGYAFMAASMGSGSTDIVWGITAGGSLSVRSFVQRSANTNLGIRIPGLFLSSLPAVVTVNTVGTL